MTNVPSASPVAIASEAQHRRNAPPLLIPALRGRIGDWAYYSCLLELGEVADRVQFARDLHPSKRLSEIIQRGMSENAVRIADYLVGQLQRFMNSIVVAVDGGEPQFHELTVRHTPPGNARPEELPELVEMNMGVLALRGDEQLMALDGQHRVKGIQLALARKKELRFEQVSTIFVAHQLTQAGLQRTRRLFTTLNRYAKPVSQRDLIAQDEDDVVAIVVRRLVDNEPLLRERISDAIGTSLSPTDVMSVTTLPALYEAMDQILRDQGPRAWADHKRLRPEENEIRARLRTARSFWNELRQQVPVLADLGRSTAGQISPIDRGEFGGHLLLRPVGLTSFARATRLLLDDGVELRQAVARLASLPMELGAPPWVKVLWNPTSKRMITAKENKDVAVAWLALAGGAYERRTLTLEHTGAELEALDQEQAPAALELLRGYRDSG